MNKRKIINWIIASPFILVVIGIAFCEPNKAYWDHRVKELCDKDGGVTIYEKVVISKEDYPNMKVTSTGQPILPFENDATKQDPFYRSTKNDLIHKGYLLLEVRRYEQSIVRAVDKKILSKSVHYFRRGGDFPTGIMHPSSYGCERNEKELFKYESVITVGR